MACADACAECAIAMCRQDPPPPDGPEPDLPAATDASPADAAADETSTGPCLQGPGTRRLWLQGRGQDPDALGRYPLHESATVIVHGEHFLVGRGSFVEFIAPLCSDIGGHVYFYMPNNEDPTAIADVTYELFVVHDGAEALVAATRDNVQYGSSGYVPFEADVTGTGRPAAAGDSLLLRVTSRSDEWYAMVIFFPPSEYMAWMDVELL
jgi:hypothetical protein